MLDASAAGLPIVVSDRVRAPERIEGNGLTYREPDPEDLALVLLTLKNPSRRRELGLQGIAKIHNRYSWRGIAQQRLADYSSVLEARRK